MKKKWPKFYKAVMVLLMTLLSISFISVTSQAASKKTNSVSLNYSSYKMEAGQKVRLKAEVLPKNASNKTVVWKTSDKSVATVSTKGLVTGKKSGAATITASVKGTKAKATCKITVVPSLPKAQSIALNYSTYTVKKGQSIKLETIIQPSDASDNPVIWKSGKKSVATVNSQGIVTGRKKGYSVITAIEKKTGLKAKCRVFVGPAVKNISVDNSSISLKIGEKSTISYKVTPQNAMNKKVSFESSDQTIATVSSKGVITAKAAGTAEIKVTAKDGSQSSAVITVTVQGTEVLPESVEITPKDNTLKAGETVQLTATVLPENATDKSVIWSSSDTAIATVSEEGLVTAISEGSVTITVKTVSGDCTATVDVKIEPEATVSPTPTPSVTPSATPSVTPSVTPSLTPSVTPTVTPEIPSIPDYPDYPTVTPDVPSEILPESVTVSPAESTLKVGKTCQLTATVLPESATNKAVVWSSSDTAVASVSDNGLVTALSEGTATITAKTVSGGFTASATITVEAGETPATKITLSVDIYELSAGSTQEVIFKAKVDGACDSVILYNSDKEKITELLDDGKYSTSGDDLQNDNTYSGKATIGSENPGTLDYYAEAVVGDNKIKSDTITISIYSKLTDEELKDIEDINKTLSEFQTTLDDEAPLEERKTETENLLEDLVEDEQIKEDTISYNEISGVFSFEYSSGVLGGVMVKDFDEEKAGDISNDESTADQVDVFSSGNMEPEQEEEPVETAINNDVFSDGEEPIYAEGDGSTEQSQVVQNRDPSGSGLLSTLIDEGTDKSNLIAGSISTNLGNALVLCAFDSDDGFPDFSVVEPEWDNAGLNTTVDSDVTVSDLRALDENNNSLVVFSMHGSILNGSPVLCLQEEPSSSKNMEYNDELKGHRIAQVVTTDGDFVYWVFPAFFSFNYSDEALSDMIIFSQSCDFMGENESIDYRMSNALLSRGADAVIGFHNSVYLRYDNPLLMSVVGELIKGEEIGNALNTATSIYGKDDGGSATEPAAYPVLTGDVHATLYNKSLENGDFEESYTPVKWSTVGDTRVMVKLGDLLPVSGSRMGLLTTGIGSAENEYLSGTEGSIISQTFYLDDDESTLSFSYDVVSEEPMEFVHTQFDDRFVVRLLDRDGNILHEFLEETVNTSQWYELQSEDLDFEGGDETIYHTTWKEVSFDISAYNDNLVTLQFVVYDMGDSIYDTAAIIDNVKVA